LYGRLTDKNLTHFLNNNSTSLTDRQTKQVELLWCPKFHGNEYR